VPRSLGKWEKYESRGADTAADTRLRTATDGAASFGDPLNLAEDVDDFELERD